MIAAALLAALAAPQEAAPLPGGVTVLESRELEELLRDAEGLLAAGETRRALADLQRVLDADPAALVRVSPDDLLFVGASRRAREILAGLSAEAAAERERTVGPRADDELRRALDPPDLLALRRVEARYAGTAAAGRAARAAEELLLDRGETERAAAGRPLEALLPGEWLPALPAPLPRAPLAAPAYAGPEDPRLPVVRGSNLFERWSYAFEDPPFPRQLHYQNHRAAVGGGLVYLTDGREVAALRLGTGEVAWRFDGPPGWDDLVDPDGGRDDARDKIVEGFDPKTVLAPVLEDGVLLVALQEPVFVGRSESFYGRIVVRRYLPARRLHAFDAATGELLWQHEPDWIHGDRDQPHGLVAAPPAAAAGRVFLPVYDATGTLDLAVQALDLHTGEPLWRTFVVSGGGETNLFGNVVRELAAGIPVADAERVLVCSNLGAIGALDAATGDALWTRLYRRADINAPQTGEVARRRETFPNAPPAYDGATFVCAPTDGDSAWALDARDGSVVRELRAVGSARGVVLRHLVGLLGRRAVFTGSHAALFDLDGGPGQDRFSDTLPHQFRDPSLLRHAGTLADGELLAPTADAILVLDPVTAAGKAAVPWSRMEQGSLHALPGMVLCMTGEGVMAYGSPEGLLHTLPEKPDPALLAEVLPLFEGFDLSHDLAVAARLARAAERLAAGCENEEQRERLLLVAGRARAELLEGEAMIADVEPLLGSSSPDRRLAAGLLLLGWLEPRDPGAALLQRALAALAEQPPTTPVAQEGGNLPLGLVWARALARAADARGETDRQREALLAVLRQPAAVQYREDGASLADWARAELDALLAAHPAQRRELEAQAAAALAEGAPSASALRAYAGTRTLTAWLREQQAVPGLALADRVRYAAWLRDYADDPGPATDLLAANERRAAAAAPALPRVVNTLGDLQLSRHDLLAAAPAPEGGAWLAMQSGGTARLVRLHPEGIETVFEHELRSPERPRMVSLRNATFLDEAGMTAVVLDRWLRFDADGGVRELRLRGDSQRVAPARHGDLLALLLEQEGGDHLLEVREIRSGELLLERPLRLDPELSKELRFDGERVFVVSVRRRAVEVVDLRDGRQSQILLSRGPSFEVPQIQTFAGGLALPDLDQGVGVLLHGADSRRSLPLAEAPLLLFGAPGGVGWIQQSSFPQEDGPPALLGWLPEGAEQPQVVEFADQDTAFLQRPPRAARQHLELPTREVLSLDTGGRLSLQRLGEARPAWTVELPLPDTVLTPVPPARAEDGWAVPFLARRRSGGAELLLYLVDAQGRLRDSAAYTVASSHPTSTSLTLLDRGQLLLRNGSSLLLLGDE